MAKVSGVEIFISGMGLLGAYLLYKGKGEKTKDQSQSWDPNDGLDPNYAGGKKIDASGPVDTHDGFRPSCQIYDPGTELFVNAGNKDWDVSKDACFGGLDVKMLPRYVDAAGIITFKTEDPLQEPDSEKGKCFFWDGESSYTSYMDLGGTTPVNRSARLCFSAGNSYNDAGQYFQRGSDGKITQNPNIPWPVTQQHLGKDVPGFYDKLTDPNDSYQKLGPEVNQCQLLKKLISTGDYSMQTAEAWVHTQNSAVFDSNVMGCLGIGGRMWDRVGNKIVYLNPYDKKPIQTAMYATN